MKRRRVKITGLGFVTPAGIGKEEFWAGILEPVSRIRPYDKLGEEYGLLVAAYMDRFSLKKFIERERQPKGISRHTQFAAAGAILAVRDTGLLASDLSGKDCVVVTGSSLP